MAEKEGDWNTSVCLSQYPVNQTPNNSEIFISVGAQAFQDYNCSTQIDNIRIGRLDKKTNDVHDLDGNFLCNLGPVKGDKTSEKDKAEKEDTVKTDTKEDVKAKEKNEKMSTETLIIIIVVSVTAVILIAVVVAAILILKKKSPKAK